MKTEPMKHQVDALERLAERPEYFALAAEQGTGKTYMLLADAERQFLAGRINAMLVIAPKGVHTNWALREIPTHLSVESEVIAWRSSMGVRRMRVFDKMVREGPDKDVLKIFCVNINAVITKKGKASIYSFLRAFDVYFALDESHLVKNPTSGRSKEIVDKFAELAVTRRPASGTLVAETPLDVYNQFEFMRPGLLGTTSYRSFVAEYAELHDDNSNLVQDIKEKALAKGRRADPQIVKTNSKGEKLYKNLPKLAKLMSPHVYRVTKKECLDLPEKIYSTHYYELDGPTRRLYDSVEATRSYLRDDGEIDIFNHLTAITKLRQLTSGFIMVEGEVDLLDDTPLTLLNADSAEPRLKALEELIELRSGPGIVWASFIEEIEQIAARLRAAGYRVAEYYGAVDAEAREAAIDGFQSGEIDVFVSNPATGGTGITLTAAEWVVYYSCSHSLVHRSQSEDRSHRIGTVKPVLYTDLVAIDTIDEKIASALQSKNREANNLYEMLEN